MNVNKSGPEDTFTARCAACGHSFQVRVPRQIQLGGRYRISYCCPRCGKQYTQTKTFSDGEGPGFGRILGIVVVVFLTVLLVAEIIGRAGNVTPVLQDLESFRQRVTGYLGGRDMVLLAAKFVVILICFPVHECAHAWMADKLGDPTGRLQGRITLNPLKHLDPWGTVMIFLVGVGYARPVPVQIRNFRHRKRDHAITALAGPASNLLLAVLMLFLAKYLPVVAGRQSSVITVLNILTYGAYINVSLAVFNMIPIPPLDGSRVLTAFLPDGSYNTLLKYERYIMPVFLVVMLVLGRAGYSPVGRISARIFETLYNFIITGGPV